MLLKLNQDFQLEQNLFHVSCFTYSILSLITGLYKSQPLNFTRLIMRRWVQLSKVFSLVANINIFCQTNSNISSTAIQFTETTTRVEAVCMSLEFLPTCGIYILGKFSQIHPKTTEIFFN